MVNYIHRVMNSNNGTTSLVDQLADYLKARKLRKTPERFALLEYIASVPGHFTLEMMQQHVEDSGFHMSRATLYNTVNLLTEAGMLRRHDIEGLPVQYELASTPPHSHLVCTTCHKLKEVRDKYFIAFMNTRKYTAFNTQYYSHYVFGTCSTCARKLKREKSANTKRKSQ